MQHGQAICQEAHAALTRAPHTIKSVGIYHGDTVVAMTCCSGRCGTISSQSDITVRVPWQSTVVRSVCLCTGCCLAPLCEQAAAARLQRAPFSHHQLLLLHLLLQAESGGVAVATPPYPAARHAKLYPGVTLPKVSSHCSRELTLRMLSVLHCWVA
eukprot:GHUV01040440.1.p1 GENE.GHUV01040440.1~~GHUV01040440.1.p1  ORF type:complete len:156 (-),score=24.37 GHUV01040440.1:321-788(-)